MIQVNNNDAFKMRLYGYEVHENNYVNKEDYENYIEDRVSDYLGSQGLI